MMILSCLGLINLVSFDICWVLRLCVGVSWVSCIFNNVWVVSILVVLSEKLFVSGGRFFMFCKFLSRLFECISNLVFRLSRNFLRFCLVGLRMCGLVMWMGILVVWIFFIFGLRL